MSSRRNRGGTLVALLAVVALAIPTGVAGLTPLTGGFITATLYPINVAAGVDAFDPHVSGNIATYTADAHIRYYDFFTGVDAQVPAPVGATDLLSDVDDGRIVFTRFSAGGAHIMVFDTATATTTEVDSQPNPLRLGAAIGQITLAFIDQTVASTGELFVAALGTPGQQVTFDDRFDQNPNVGSGGGPIVFESCATDPSNCDIRMAFMTGGSHYVWTAVTDTPEPEANPDSDGSLIAYDATRTGERDIYWRTVDLGGSEVRLEMPGEQRNPSISDGIVTFESVPVGGSTADLFAYEIATNRLFQVTSTVGIEESLNDAFVLSNGSVRLVWAQGPIGDRDVRGADLVLPPLGPTYSFGGFLQPVDARPTLNLLKAGAAVPVKFSLGGNQGMSIFAAGYPKSQAIPCNDAVDVDGIETTVTAGGSGLAYDPTTDTYTYIWKTDKAWAGTCRQLVLEFADAGSTTARANFKFK